MTVEGVDPLAAQVAAALVARGATVATAESLTGGLLAATLVSVPGVSAVFRGGVVSYATELKASLLGVAPDLLDRVGAVDPDVAAAMAEGAAVRLGATYAVATTGVAGPDPQDGLPAGTAYVAVTGPAGTRVERLAHDPGLGRDAIRRAVVHDALTLLLDVLAAGRR